MNFVSIPLPRGRFSSLNLFRLLLSYSRGSDVCIGVFDIHFWDVILAVLFAGRYARKLFWGHGLGRSFIGRKLRLLSSCFVDGIIVYGKNGYKQLLDAGIDEKKLFIAPNTMWTPNASDFSSNQKQYFLFVGRIQYRKRLDLFLSAYRMYADKFGRAALGCRIVGSGPDDCLCSTYEHYSRDLRLDVQWFPGTTDHDLLSNYFSSAIAYVSPGHVGLGVLHAFSYGVPLITCNVPGHAPEFENIVHAFNGLIVDLSVSSIAKSLEDLTLDRSLATALGHNAFTTYSTNAGPSAMIDGFVDALSKKKLR